MNEEFPARDATVDAAMRGDRKAIYALWYEHRRWIAAVLLAHKSQYDQLEDLLQEVAMTLVSKIGNLRDTRNIRAWLRTVAVNTARASARSGKSAPRLRLAGQELVCSAMEAGERVALDDEARRLLDLVSRLPEAYREPLMLRAVHGMRGKHIAEILELSAATVETRIARARRMLREYATPGPHMAAQEAALACAATSNVQGGSQ